MESTVLRAKDYHEVDLGARIKPFVLNEAALDQELRRLTNRHILWEPGEEAEAGDLVTCSLASDCPRFCKDRVRFTAGSGMFHLVLEQLSIGMSVNETREADLPEGRVALTVTDVIAEFMYA